MGKMVVLKPVVWNNNGYLGPTGEVTSGGYAGEHGYGHEEWNGRTDWVWNGWKVFHTQGKGLMFDYAARGDLGIIMTTMRDGRFYAVGLACAVYANDEDDRSAIAKDLKLKANGKDLWELEGIRKRKASKAEFDRHWKEAHSAVQWRCPQSHFVWFNKPIEIVPDDVIPSGTSVPRQAIVKMHGSYQAIRPDQALAIVQEALPASHPGLAWLSTDDFDAVQSAGVRNAPPPRRGSGVRSAGTAINSYSRYLQENEVQVTPKHHKLQSDFETY
ncbi:hypothetical protein, partial [Novosphingobium pentaromativorans]